VGGALYIAAVILSKDICPNAAEQEASRRAFYYGVLQTHVHIAGLIEHATSKAEQMTPARARRTNSRCRQVDTSDPSCNVEEPIGPGGLDWPASVMLPIMATAGPDRVDRKATYSRAMDVPEGALLAVKDLPVELVSFLIHSEHNTHTHTHTHSFDVHSDSLG